MNAPPLSWWGDYDLPPASSARWQIGPLKVYVQRQAGEWRIAHEHGPDPLERGFAVEAPGPETDVLALANPARLALAGAGSAISLRPLLADRPVVVRPVLPFEILAGEEITIFLTTVVWVRISAGPHVLFEHPAFRPSDTWFGPSTGEGQLCYAGRAFCQLEPDAKQPWPHRAMTRVELKNRASENLLLERLKIPVEHLSIYAEATKLWTQDVIFERARGDAFATLRLTSAPPTLARGAELIAAPRVRSQENIVMRAFNELLGR